jgi:hypothetical protein
MTVSKELIDQLLAGYTKPEDLIGENGLLKQLTKRLVERALEAEMTEHLGHTNNASVANTAGNVRNGKSKKTLKGDFGELPIGSPCDRHASFEPQIVPKQQGRWAPDTLAWNCKARPCNFICLKEFNDTLKTNLKSSRRRQCQSASRPALWANRAWS